MHIVVVGCGRVGSELAGHLERNGYLRDVLERLPLHPASRIDELLPHRWRPIGST